jgi:hypothetical protein
LQEIARDGSCWQARENEQIKQKPEPVWHL